MSIRNQKKETIIAAVIVLLVVLYCLFIVFEIVASIPGTNIEYRPFQIIAEYISHLGIVELLLLVLFVYLTLGL